MTQPSFLFPARAGHRRDCYGVIRAVIGYFQLRLQTRGERGDSDSKDASDDARSARSLEVSSTRTQHGQEPTNDRTNNAVMQDPKEQANLFDRTDAGCSALQTPTRLSLPGHQIPKQAIPSYETQRGMLAYFLNILLIAREQDRLPKPISQHRIQEQKILRLYLGVIAFLLLRAREIAISLLRQQKISDDTKKVWDHFEAEFRRKEKRRRPVPGRV